MKILHFNDFHVISPGVKKQLLYEISAAKKLPSNIHWDTVVFCSSSELGCQEFIHKRGFWGVNKISRVVTLFTSLIWLLSRAPYYDIIIVRHSKLLLFLSFFKRVKCKLITIHHAKEYDEEKLRASKKNKIDAFFDKYITRNLYMKLYGVAGVTTEILDFEAKRFQVNKANTFVYPNGIDFQQVQLAEDKRGGDVKFVMMASEYHLWHGLEYILDKFFDFERHFELHIIGLIRNQDLIEKIKQDQRIFYYGYQESYQYSHILAMSDLALGSFGIHLKNLKQASSLKVREYLASGLPVYSGHTDYVFENKMFPYYCKGELDPDNMYEMALQFRAVNRSTIREAAFPFIDKGEILQKIANELFISYHAGAF